MFNEGFVLTLTETGTTREDEGCISQSPRVRQDLLQGKAGYENFVISTDSNRNFTTKTLST